MFVIVNALNQEDTNGCILNIHVYKCVFAKGGVCYFSHPDGGVMQFYHLGIGGGSNFFFSYSEALSATSPLR